MSLQDEGSTASFKEETMQQPTTVSCTVIRIPPYLSAWDMEEAITTCTRKMSGLGGVYLLDMGGVRNVYRATLRLLRRLSDRSLRLGARLYITNACDTVENALRNLELDIPLMGSVYELERVEVKRSPAPAMQRVA
jgi:anti-anti-sigma regulatory factor